MRRGLLQFVTLCLLALFPACSRDVDLKQQKGTTKKAQVVATKITIAAITDFHGAIEPIKAMSADGKAIYTGGAANLSSHIRVLENSVDGPLLLVDGGDMFQGTMESNLFEGSPVIRLYNHLKVRAAALGNHEFDFGPIGEKAVPRSPEDDPRGALRARSQEAEFPILAANVVDEEGKTPDWAKPSVIIPVQGVRVGIIGAATMKTPATTNRMNLGGLSFKDPVPAILAEAKRLREEEAVSIVVLTMHEGGGCDDNRLEKQDDLSSCTIKDVFEIVQALPEGTLDVVVAGHTHRGVAKRIGRTAIMQAYSSGQFLAWAEVNVADPSVRPEVKGLAEVCGNTLAYNADGETRLTCDAYKLKRLKGDLAPARFLGVYMHPDPDMESVLGEDIQKVKELKRKPLGVRALTPFEAGYSEESALGNLVADATRVSTEGVELGLANGGGLRAPIAAGELSYGDIFAVLPFDNQLAVMSVNGAELQKMLELGISGKQGALLWSGLTFRARGCSVEEALIGGEPLTPVRVYRIATSDYLALGGSGMNTIGIPESQVQVFWDRPYVLRDVVVRELPRWPELRSQDFYNRAAPRQKKEGRCG